MSDPTNEERGDSDAAHVDDGDCADVLYGLASGKRVADVVQHLRECAMCEKRFQVMAADLECLRADPLPHRAASGEFVLAPRELRARRAELAGRNTVHKALEAWRSLRARLARPMPAAALTAAALALLIAAFLGRRAPVSSENAYWIPAGREFVLPRTGEDIDGYESLRAGIRAYEARDLDAAILALGAMLSVNGAQEDLRRLYLASALTLDGDVSGALDVLAGLDSARLPQPWRDESLWIRYVALVGAGQAHAAREMLAALAEKPGPIGERARDVIGAPAQDASPDLP